MSKKRKTLKEKQKAAERRLAWSQNLDVVKRGIQRSKFSTNLATTFKKQPEKSGQFADTSLLVRDLAKTLLFAAGIFSLEIVIYLAWFK